MRLLKDKEYLSKVIGEYEIIFSYEKENIIYNKQGYDILISSLKFNSFNISLNIDKIKKNKSILIKQDIISL